MARNIDKWIEEARGILTDKTDMDIKECQQLFEISNHGQNLFEAIFKAFRFGVTVGYKIRERKSKA